MFTDSLLNIFQAHFPNFLIEHRNAFVFLNFDVALRQTLSIVFRVRLYSLPHR